MAVVVVEVMVEVVVVEVIEVAIVVSVRIKWWMLKSI